MNLPSKECCENTDVSRIKFEERRSKAIFVNPERSKFVRIRIDGCAIPKGKAADWVLCKPGVGDIIIELKGRSVEHAVKQVSATVQEWAAKGWCCGKIGALIVTTQVPKATISQKVQLEFRRSYGCPIHIVSHNQEFTFEKLFSSFCR